ncbi:MAG TPA: beta-galactosidase, partial [Mariniflexile sp.]|nr:beta-galactosidase [Mariniflexile sp.]
MMTSFLKKQYVLLASLVLLFLQSVSASNFQNEKTLRTKVNINDNWMYAETNVNAVNDLKGFNNWTQINLPHSWNIEDVTDSEPGYRRSASWYKKTIPMQTVDENKNYILYFEAANITTNVYVNGKEAGKHIGGYIGFEIDITNFVKTGTNEVLVRVDNSFNPEVIPSQQSDFFIYGGITRDVWLLTVPKNHIAAFQMSTPSVSQKAATLKIKTAVANPDNISGLKLRADVFNPSGKKVASKTVLITNNDTELNFETIKNPELWDTQTPNLYTANIYLIHNKVEVDVVSDKIGFRWFEFKDHGPFYLNGKRLLLRGTHRHEEQAGVGPAMSNAQHRKDMED